jgi:hypothetical protein
MYHSTTSHTISLPKGMTVDAGIIEEQEDHLVFAVRVSRETLARNHPLLAAVSERLDAPRLPSWWDHLAPITVRQRRWLLSAAGALATLLALGTTQWHARLHAENPPLVMFQAYAENSVVKPEGELRVRSLVHHRRLCESVLHRTIRDAEGIVVWENQKSGLNLAITAEPIWYSFGLRLPAGLKDGPYTYESYNYIDCGNGDTYITPKPKIPFTIASAKAASNVSPSGFSPTGLPVKGLQAVI